MSKASISPILNSFLSEMADPIIIPQFQRIPNFAGSVPSYTALKSLVAFITPMMDASPKDEEQILNHFDSATVRIVFNESDLRINIRPKQKTLTLVITPKSPSFYHVREKNCPNEILSPISSGTILHKASLFNFKLAAERSACIEKLITGQVENNLPFLIAETPPTPKRKIRLNYWLTQKRVIDIKFDVHVLRGK